MFKIKILSPGKIKEAWLEEALHEYMKRLTPVASFELIWTKEEKQWLKLATQEKDPICLDPHGKMFTSEAFSSYFFDLLEKRGSSLTFLIGGPDGFPPGFTANKPLISLSPMTFTHQMARLLLLEQIFRAFEIRRGSGYHR